MMVVRVRTGVACRGLRAYPSNLNRLKTGGGSVAGVYPGSSETERHRDTRRYVVRPTVLTIAGSDCSGGAGIQADLKAIEANRGYAASVITAITAQNTLGVHASQAVSGALVAEQLDAVLADLDVAAAKTGMLGNADVVAAVIRQFRRSPVRHFVCDPVFASSTGTPLLDRPGIDLLVEELIPLATLVTPNVHEAGAISGVTIRNPDDARRAGQALVARGARAVLVTGGHLEHSPGTDTLVTENGCTFLPGELLDLPHTHGSGCTLSATIATLLAHGLELQRAVETSKRFVTDAIRRGLPVGTGAGPTDPFFFLHDERASAWIDDAS
jgi:hydroxymethylpyrimidine/phosphomethylpyrimidine kinase